MMPDKPAPYVCYECQSTPEGGQCGNCLKGGCTCPCNTVPEGMGRFTVVHDGPSRPMLSLGNRIFRVEEFINGRWQGFDDDEAICAALAHPTSESGTAELSRQQSTFSDDVIPDAGDHEAIAIYKVFRKWRATQKRPLVNDAFIAGYKAAKAESGTDNSVTPADDLTAGVRK